MAQKIQQRGGTLADWTTYNPIISEREMVIETDTNKFKIGNGIDHYLDLPYVSQGTEVFVYEQTAPSNIWVINHGLGFYPYVLTLDAGGSMIEGEIRYNSNTQIEVEFSIALSGVAHLS